MSSMDDWFTQTPAPPLAEALRPKTIDDVVGQTHLLGPGKPLRLAFDAGKPHSMILWGPPGTGKTTLARLMANVFKADFISISAVLSGVKEVRAAVERAEHSLQNKCIPSILFIDEIHRFNKSQQDALLPFVESGLFTFIGATTENPGFEINAALLSRAQVYVLQSLNQAELIALIKKAQQISVAADTAAKTSPFRAGWTIDEPAMTLLAEYADGDARRLFNLLEQALNSLSVSHPNIINCSLLQKVLTAKNRRFDKGGDIFYDQISALHKSIRGSHPDAALYWFCRMLDGGADPHYLARRIIRQAWEDIGLADPRAMQIANEAASCYERLGSPEGELALAQAVIYLACASKSNAGYTAFNQAMQFVKTDQSRLVPMHLRNAPTKLQKSLGHGSAYRYAHHEANAYAAGEQYLPDGMKEPAWYQPAPRGLEIKIAEKLALLRSFDKNVQNNESD